MKISDMTTANLPMIEKKLAENLSAGDMNIYLVARMVARGDASLTDAIETVNNSNLATAVIDAHNSKGVKWFQVLHGTISYISIIADIEEVTAVCKALRPSNVVSLRKVKDSPKSVLGKNIREYLEVFGANLCDNFVDMDTDTLKRLKRTAVFNPSVECFVSDETKGRNASSVGQLEKQANHILTALVGKNAPVVQKAHIRHLRTAYVRATKEGYRNGNALALLNLLALEVQAVKKATEYTMHSALEIHAIEKK